MRVHPWTLKYIKSKEQFWSRSAYRLKRWNVRTTCKAVNCFSNIACVKYSIVTSHLHLHLHQLLLSWQILSRHSAPTNSRAKKEDYMKAWNYIKNHCDQETGKKYSTIVQIIVKDDRGKAFAWRSASCKMTCYHLSDEKNSINSQYAFCTQSAFCILYLVCILRQVCSLQFVFCSDRIGIAVFVRASLKSGPKKENWRTTKLLKNVS